MHYPEPDLSGHIHGWMTEKYLESLKEVDIELEKIISTVNTELQDDNYLLIITSDHGGTDKTHGKELKEHITIPWIAHGSSVKTNHKIESDIKIYDTATTILHFLNVEIPNGLDGKIITEIFN